LSEPTIGGLTQEFLVIKDKEERRQPYDARLKNNNDNYQVYFLLINVQNPLIATLI
jgi:hypothetical protein